MKLQKRIILISLIFSLFASSLKAQIITEDSQKLSQVLWLINTFYVDTVSASKIVDNAIIEMLKELDPHSVYFNKKDVEDANSRVRGNFEGIGVQFNILNDTIYIVSPISGGPSEKLGIHSGDRIVTVEGEIVAGIGINNQGVRTRLLGKKGTEVKVGIKRKGVRKILDFSITRDKIPINSLDAAYMATEDIGYVKLNSFSATTIREFRDAMKDLDKKGMKQLILDLRDNGGGLLMAATELTDQFLDRKKIVVYTEGQASPRNEIFSTTWGNFESGKLVVLIDEGSASASEIVSGAIQDWDRGVLIGRRSFGKGLVQRPFTLKDGSQIRLTTARYFTPTGRSIQKSYKGGSVEYRKELIDRYNSGQLISADSIHFPDSLRYYTQKAKRVVYGGGGIMPDVFVPIDTNGYTSYFRDLIRTGSINRYIMSYFDENRKELLQKYPDFLTYKREFIVTEAMLKNLIKVGEKKEVEFNETEMNTSKEEIKLRIKAVIANNIWSTSEYFEIVNVLNLTYKKAIQILHDNEAYKKLLQK